MVNIKVLRESIKVLIEMYEEDLKDEELMKTKCTYENVAKVSIRHLKGFLKLLEK